MSQQQYYNIMSNLLKEKHALALLRAKLEEKRERECWNCKGFGHLVHNCRNRKEREKRMAVPQNKFEVLKSRVMRYKVEERTIRRQEVAVVECFKCREEGHKCRVCPLWKKKE